MFVLQGPTDFAPCKLFSHCFSPSLFLPGLLYLNVKGWKATETKKKKPGQKKSNVFLVFDSQFLIYASTHTHTGADAVF